MRSASLVYDVGKYDDKFSIYLTNNSPRWSLASYTLPPALQFDLRWEVATRILFSELIVVADGADSVVVVSAGRLYTAQYLTAIHACNIAATNSST